LAFVSPPQFRADGPPAMGSQYYAV
jgi:hypothetical protein